MKKILILTIAASLGFAGCTKDISRFNEETKSAANVPAETLFSNGQKEFVDIYSSTKTIFDHIGPSLRPGTVIVFDEWHGYSTGNPEEHEQKAFKEFVADHPNFIWQVIGHGPQQWAIRVTTDITGAFR